MGHCVATTGGEGDFEVEHEVFIGDGGLGEDAFEVVRELRRRDKFIFNFVFVGRYQINPSVTLFVQVSFCPVLLVSEFMRVS